jgi:hypothetical protein
MLFGFPPETLFSFTGTPPGRQGREKSRSGQESVREVLECIIGQNEAKLNPSILLGNGILMTCTRH